MSLNDVDQYRRRDDKSDDPVLSDEHDDPCPYQPKQ